MHKFLKFKSVIIGCEDSGTTYNSVIKDSHFCYAEEIIALNLHLISVIAEHDAIIELFKEKKISSVVKVTVCGLDYSHEYSLDPLDHFLIGWI
jgi:hypothetical protein